MDPFKGTLSIKAPRVYQFLENLRLDLEDMQSLLLEVAGKYGYRVPLRVL